MDHRVTAAFAGAGGGAIGIGLWAFLLNNFTSSATEQVAKFLDDSTSFTVSIVVSGTLMAVCIGSAAQSIALNLLARLARCHGIKATASTRSKEGQQD